MRITITLMVALVLAFTVGYVTRAITTPVVATTTNAAACPPGTHAAVWYTAHAWACVVPSS